MLTVDRTATLLDEAARADIAQRHLVLALRRLRNLPGNVVVRPHGPPEPRRGDRLGEGLGRGPGASLPSQKGSEMTSTPTVDDHGLTAERLAGVGRRYELTGDDGQRLSVVIDSRGSRHISVIARDQHSSPGKNVVVFNEAQAGLLSCILAGTYDRAQEAWSRITTHTS
jgi:hypothetical protein